ncbi:Clathrin heavy chain [Wickerhamiella sorbophila]|uniref:Clathrin heavy chain n=1 Tax=Wickerhamiella sorbophila TaxID=45607 RepID=A0A2T0FCL4_9ASCO|nr:Clathrin heavy chain [Wickerhamiella sorbophila]PRT52721.1 Clathrin heavy chain [Wickerhamiella sorbophila]
MADLPIKFQENLKLSAVGVPDSAVGFNTCTLESDRFVCVREESAAGNQVAIIDLKNANEVTRKAMTADSAIMCPNEMIVALRAQDTVVQVVNLATKQRLKNTTMTEPITFWKWVSPSTLGLITARSIYHWDILDASQASPVKVTDVHATMAGAQLINYEINGSGKWTVLTGISEQGGRIVGRIQLFSHERQMSQAIEGHAAGFGTLQLEGGSIPADLFTFVNRTEQGAKLHVIEIDHQDGQPVYQKKQVDMFFPPEFATDFPVACQVIQKYGIIFVVTRMGFIHLYDLDSGAAIFMNRLSSQQVFVTCKTEDRGIMVINRGGQVLSVEVNEDNIVQYILNNGNPALALALASRAGLSGADSMYTQQFELLLSQGQYSEAAKIAASSPRGILRTQNTIQRLKNVQAPPGEVSPILQYFSSLLDRGTLNKHESIELATPVLQQDRKQLLEKWIRENKLTPSEELGDLIRPYDVTLALAIYLRANVPLKVVAGFAELGEFDKIMPYCEKVGYKPDYALLLQNIVRSNPDKAAEFAQSLVANPATANELNMDRIVDVFLGQNLVQQATAFLLDALKDNSPQHAHLQTRLLETNLMNAPQVADAILGNQMFSHYDRHRIASLAEKAELYQRALENYDDIKDIKRVIVHAHTLPQDWLLQFFASLTVEQTVEVLREMLRVNVKQNLQTVIQVAIKYADLVGAMKLVALFEEFKTAEGLYYFLQSIVNLTEDPAVVFKYITAAASIGQFSEIQRIVSDNRVYNPEKVKNFLKDARLADQLPLITLCDKHGFVHELVLYLYQNQQFQFIQVYVQQVNPSSTPQVIAGLLDVDADEQRIKDLLDSVVGQVPIEPLVAEVEKRNRLKLLLPLLEKTIAGGSQEPAVYDTLAKVYIDSNNNPEKFLRENTLYNPLVVGAYCESRDPYLAVIAYERGQNDQELINITNENSMFKHQARYLVNRGDIDLWASVLSEGNVHRRQLVDQVVAVAVPESQNAENVAIVVKAFMGADLPGELIELLEKIILEPSPFSENENLQNLLILTAIKAEKSKVSNLIERLDKYDVDEIAQLCLDHDLNEEALQVYNKADRNVDGMRVLTEHIMSLDRASDYAEKYETPELYSALAKAQLAGLRVSDSLSSYIKAQDPSNFAEVIEIAERAGKDDELVDYLKMARRSLREPLVDGQLMVCYATLGRTSELNELVDGPNVADVEAVGDKLVEREQHQAAKKLYSSISNWAKLATTLVHLGEYQAAVDAARKASSVKVWKEVNEACLDKKEFKLAQICGLNLIVHAEEMHGLVSRYEYMGAIEELISLLEQGLGLERAHMGMFTELAVVFSKYHPEKLMEHLNLFWSRINIPKVIRACEAAHLWPELVFLYCHYDEFDNASLAMIEHAADAFDHNSFKDIVVKVANLEIYYKAISFYMSEQPQLISDLLAALTPRIDVERVVRMFQKSDNLPMIKSFLVAVQDKNLSSVNSAYHDLLIEEEDAKSLRDSVDAFDKYDPIDLAQRLEKHELIQFRQIAAHLYAKNKKWSKSISLSKEDKLWADSIRTAALSGKTEVSEDLLRYFVDIGNKECYVATLYTCYELIRPDVVEELSWRFNLRDYTMPYFINQKREQLALLDELKAAEEARKAAAPTDEEAAAPVPLMIGYTY